MTNPNSIDEGFAKIPEIAQAFNVTEATVQRWIRDGRLPAIRLGRLVLIPQDALRILIERQEARDDR